MLPPRARRTFADAYIGNACSSTDYTYTMTAAVKAVMTWPDSPAHRY